MTAAGVHATRQRPGSTPGSRGGGAAGTRRTLLAMALWAGTSFYLRADFLPGSPLFKFQTFGIGIGAVIHGWVPESFFVRYAGPDNPLAVPVAVLIGIPLYSNAAGVLPLIEALYAKGLAMGTLLAFMMAVVALSLPEIILLRRILKPPLIAAFVGIVGGGIVLVGYLFNAVL